MTSSITTGLEMLKIMYWSYVLRFSTIRLPQPLGSVMKHVLPRLVATVFALCTAFSSSAFAQTYPHKPIRLVVPYGPGGPSDIVARVVSDEMGKRLGQVLIVDNKPGAGSMVGTELVVRSPADGYTILLTDLPVTVVPHVLRASAKYDPVRDLEPIALIGRSTLGFYVAEQIKSPTIGDFVSFARAQKDGVRIGSGGNGSLTHLMAEVFAGAAGFQMTHLPYQGTGPAMPDLLAGRLDGMFNSYLATQSYLPGGKVRALGLAARERAAELPSVPTFAESGLPDVSVDYWLALVGPIGMPASTSATLRKALGEALQSASVQEKFKALAVTPTSDLRSETLRQTIQSDYQRWGRVVRDRNITAN